MRRLAIRSAFLVSLVVPPAIAGCGGVDSINFSQGGGGAAGGTTTTTSQGGSGGVAGGGGSIGGTAGGGGSIGGTAGSGGSQTGGGGSMGGTGGAPPSCGNGQKNGMEQCDGADLGASTCVDFGYTSPAGLACTPECKLDPSGCMPTCDGAKLEPGEKCDGANLGGASCVDFGYVNPAGATCNAACDGVDSSGCMPACNGTLEPGEACDGANLNGHTCTEFGFVNAMGLACTACALDPAGCKPTCGNGTVEPGEACDDGNVANGDGCSSMCTVEALACAGAIPVNLALGTQDFTGTTVGGGAHNGTCASAAADRVYAVTAGANGFMTAWLVRADTAYPSVLYARTSCDNAASEILCADSKDPQNAAPVNGGEVVSFPVTSGQVVYVVVDGATANDAGNYHLRLDLSTGVDCNDPVPIRLEKGTPMKLLGGTTGKGASQNGNCGGTLAEDVVYDVQVAVAGQVNVSIDAAGTNYNSVLYLRNQCGNGFTQIGCDNANGNGGENLNYNAQASTSVFAWVDGSMGANGNFALVVSPPP
ncbi:MAG: myxococcus cysteine-rich repeat containing protein [Polyangiaceae bacterium]